MLRTCTANSRRGSLLSRKVASWTSDHMASNLRFKQAVTAPYSFIDEYAVVERQEGVLIEGLKLVKAHRVFNYMEIEKEKHTQVGGHITDQDSTENNISNSSENSKNPDKYERNPDPSEQEASDFFGKSLNRPVLLMYSSLGRFMGRMMVLAPQVDPHTIKRNLEEGSLHPDVNPPGVNEPISDSSDVGRIIVNPDNTINNFHMKIDCSKLKVRSCDHNDVKLFVEQCERFINHSNDLIALSRVRDPELVVTITGIPRSYGRQDLSAIIKEHAGVIVDPHVIVFHFSKGGHQADTAFISCPTQHHARVILAKIQEVAVPKRRAFGESFGCSFLWASRQTIFVPCFDPLIVSKFLPEAGPSCRLHLLSRGWDQSVSTKEVSLFLRGLKINPVSIIEFQQTKDKETSVSSTEAGNKHDIEGTTSFVFGFNSMNQLKQCAVSLKRVSQRWKLNKHSVFISHCQLVDLHWSDDVIYRDEIEYTDDDIDETVE